LFFIPNWGFPWMVHWWARVFSFQFCDFTQTTKSSTQRFNHIWLWIIHESKILILNPFIFWLRVGIKVLLSIFCDLVTLYSRSSSTRGISQIWLKLREESLDLVNVFNCILAAWSQLKCERSLNYFVFGV